MMVNLSVLIKEGVLVQRWSKPLLGLEMSDCHNQQIFVPEVRRVGGC